MQTPEDKAKRFETELLKALPFDLALEHQSVSRAITSMIECHQDPTSSPELIRRLFKLQADPHYIDASERAAEKIYGENFSDIIDNDSDPTLRHNDQNNEPTMN